MADVLCKELEYIININKELKVFWSNSFGWAPTTAANILSISRLDWQVSLSKSLKRWVGLDKISDGDLILAWANLGALVEGTLKFFLSVFHEDYQSDANKFIKRDGSLIEPQNLKFDSIRQFIEKLNILSPGSQSFIKHIQHRRNAIHAYNDRDIGDYEDFLDSVTLYLDLLFEIESCLPYP